MNKLSRQQKDEIAKLTAQPDDEIDTSDIRERDDWKNAEVGKFYRPIKQPVTMRLDADVVAWFRKQHPKYQTAINRVLREYMRKHPEKDHEHR